MESFRDDIKTNVKMPVDSKARLVCFALIYFLETMSEFEFFMISCQFTKNILVHRAMHLCSTHLISEHIKNSCKLSPSKRNQFNSNELS